MERNGIKALGLLRVFHGLQVKAEVNKCMFCAPNAGVGIHISAISVKLLMETNATRAF